MNLAKPHFLLFAETGLDEQPGGWRFILRTAEGRRCFVAADVETDVFGERLELLTLIRALESLDQPSRVTLVGSTNYLRQGIQYGMPQWRTEDWLWEWFGQMVPVKNADLWQRLDRLMAFHQVECRQRRIDGAHQAATMPNYLAPRGVSGIRLPVAMKALSARAWNRLPLGFRRRMVACEGKLRQFALAPLQAMRTLRTGIEDVLVLMLRRRNEEIL
jgi:ribonuclease HI